MRLAGHSFRSYLETLEVKQIAKLFALWGCSTGLLIWIALFVSEQLLVGIGGSGVGIVFLHKQGVCWWFIDALPLLLGILGYRIGRFYGVWMESARLKAVEEEASIRQLCNFTSKVVAGVLDADADFDSTSELGYSVLQLRDMLAEIRLQQQQRTDMEKQHSWVADGLAMFGELLRLHSDGVEKLSNEVIKNLVKYLNANQGGFFLLVDADGEKRHFLQTAAFAYDRQKLVRKRVEWGDGLIGACAFEREYIYMTDIPDGYLNISSGLGLASPRSLLLMPLIAEGEVQGVMEIASFQKFEKHEIDFVQHLSAAIATTVKSVKVSTNTALLLEQSQRQAEMLKAQEEEMVRNIEELHTLQEESARKSTELANFTESVNTTLVMAEYSTEGMLISANSRFLTKLGYEAIEEIMGCHLSLFINNKDREWFSKIWADLLRGGTHFEGDMKHVTKQGTDFWSMATYTCVRDKNGTVQKILFMGIDITNLKKMSLDLESQVFALNSSTVTVEFDPSAGFRRGNDKFLEILGFTPEILEDFTAYDLFTTGNNPPFNDVWVAAIGGRSVENQLEVVARNGNSKWLQGTFTAVYDMYNELAKVIFIANDITSQKLLELETQHKTEQLISKEELLKVSQHKLQQKLAEIEAVKIRNEETLEGAMDAIITINSQEVVEVFNRAAVNMLGYGKSEVVGKNIRVLLSDKLKILPEGEIVRYLSSGANQFCGARSEVTINDKWGNEIAALVTISEAKIGDDCTFTAFIQNISVELF